MTSLCLQESFQAYPFRSCGFTGCGVLQSLWVGTPTSWFQEEAGGTVAPLDMLG